MVTVEICAALEYNIYYVGTEHMGFFLACLL